jgi:hypothetical protein
VHDQNRDLCPTTVARAVLSGETWSAVGRRSGGSASRCRRVLVQFCSHAGELPARRSLAPLDVASSTGTGRCRAIRVRRSGAFEKASKWLRRTASALNMLAFLVGSVRRQLRGVTFR